MQELIDRLRLRLAQPDMGQVIGTLVFSKARRGSTMGPQLSYGRHRGPARDTTRRAAVLLAMYEHDGHWWFPLTVRHSGMTRHQGQISLPGGLIEPGEKGCAAAVREFNEELGPARIEILDHLEACYVYVSDTFVTPWIGVIAKPREWQPNPREVERVIEVPLVLLTDPTARRVATLRRGPLHFTAPGYAIGDDHVWGATAVILEQLSMLLPQLPEN